MPPFFPDRPRRWGRAVFPDIPLRREPFVPPIAGVAFPELTWPAPVFLNIPPRRWAQLFPAGPLPLWQPFLEVPSAPSRRWERCFPAVRGGPLRKRERLPVFSGGSARRDERLFPRFSGRLPRRV
jgi:hypothetical protein